MRVFALSLPFWRRRPSASQIWNLHLRESPTRVIPASLCEESNIHGEFTSVYLDSKRIYSWKGSEVLPMGFRPLADGSVAGVVKGAKWTSAELFYIGAESGRSLPEGYSLRSPGAILCGESAEDGVTLGLSSKTGGRAILWENGDVDSLNFRGTVTAVLQE